MYWTVIVTKIGRKGGRGKRTILMDNTGREESGVEESGERRKGEEMGREESRGKKVEIEECGERKWGKVGEKEERREGKWGQKKVGGRKRGTEKDDGKLRRMEGITSVIEPAKSLMAKHQEKD